MRVENALCAGALLLAFATAVHGGEISNRKMSWAHHTPWHTPFNTSLTAINYYNFPLQDSTGNDVEDWKQEFANAKAQGIDGFFPDLVANKGGGPTAFVDAMHTMLKAAEGSDFQIGVCLDVKTNVDQQVKELKRMLDLFGKHPNYPHWNGRPVVSTYTFLSWTPEELAAIRTGLKKAGYDIFLIGNLGVGYETPNAEKLRPYLEQADMIYAFAMQEIDKTTIEAKAKLFERLCAETGTELMTTVYPGYYGAWLNGRNGFYQVHCGFDQAHRSFEAANSSKAKFLSYTTWNDHDETSLLPMVFTPANPLITKAYTDCFKGIDTVTGKPEVMFAHHREEIPGTLLRFEAMTLPTLKSGKVEVKGRLLDETGNAVAQLPVKSLAGNKFDRVEWLVPSTALAKHPLLIPEFTVNGETVRLPEVLLVNGWHQNAVTVKTAASRIIMPESSLQLKAEADGRIRVSGSYNSTVELKRVSLWRNDRPVAVIAPEAEGKSLLNVYLSGKPNLTVTPENGKIISAVKKFEENNSKNFKWDAASLRSTGSLSWTPVALTVAGTPDLKLRFAVAGQEPLVLSAAELAKRERIEYGNTVIQAAPADGTMQNRAALNRKSGAFDFALFAKARPQDRWQLHFESADGRSGWSVPVWPFAGNTAPIPAKLVETATTLETASDATGWVGRSEYLSPTVPFQTPALRDAEISRLSIRGGRWDFEKNGIDRYGDMPVVIPEAMFTDGAPDEGKALRFTGKDEVKMRLHTYPLGGSTVEFLIRPDAGREKPQGIVTRSGWSDAVNVYLLPDGRIETVRDGSSGFKEEKTVSNTAVPDNAWSRVRVTCDNAALRIWIDGKQVAEQPVSPQRCYGNCTWHLGKGDKRSANFTGCLDAVTVFGAAFAPGDANEPKLGKAEQFRPIVPPGTPEADEATAVTGKWNYPANVELRPETGETPALLTERQKAPVLAGPGTLLLGPGANTVRADADGVELADNTMLSVRLRRFDRAEPKKAWYALLVSIGNDEKKSVNFNFGSDKEVMITVNDPAWKIQTGNFKLTLPADLQIARREGMLIFLLNGKAIYKTEDDPAHPYTRLSFSTSSPNRDDATAIRIDPPVRYQLR